MNRTSNPQPRARRSFAAGMALAVALSGVFPPLGAIAKTIKSTGSSETASVTQRLWSALLTRCGDTYFYAGSVFDGSGMLSNVEVGHQKVMEFRGVRFHSVPIRVTDAERANGLTYRARISMIAHLYREGDDQWQDGPDLRPRNVDDIFGQVLSQANGNFFDMGGGGAMALELLKFKGEWVVTRSSTDFSGSLGSNDNYYDVDKLVALRVARYSCQQAAVIPPPPTAAELAAQQEAARKAAEEAAAQAADDQQDRQADAQDAKGQ